MITPAISVNGETVIQGKIPIKEEILEVLEK